MNEKLPDQVSEFSVENCPNGNLAKVAKFHTNPYKFLACLPNPYKLSILVGEPRPRNERFVHPSPQKRFDSGLLLFDNSWIRPDSS